MTEEGEREKEGSDEELLPEENQEGEAEDVDDERVLVEPEEWKDPEPAKVISEFHKEGLAEGDKKVSDAPIEAEEEEEEDADLASWLEHWKGRSSYKVLSEYHKEGAPYLDQPFIESVPAPRTIESTSAPPDGEEEEESAEVVGEPGAPEGRKKRSRGLHRIIDIHTIELLFYALARAAFPRKVAFKLYKEGIVDMDVRIEDEDVVLDANKMFFEFPEMAIWKITFAYQGKPIFDIGRGVKNGFKIHRLNFILALFRIWFDKRAKERKKRREAMKG